MIDDETFAERLSGRADLVAPRFEIDPARVVRRARTRRTVTRSASPGWTVLRPGRISRVRWQLPDCCSSHQNHVIRCPPWIRRPVPNGPERSPAAVVPARRPTLYTQPPLPCSRRPATDVT